MHGRGEEPSAAAAAATEQPPQTWAGMAQMVGQQILSSAGDKEAPAGDKKAADPSLASTISQQVLGGGGAAGSEKAAGGAGGTDWAGMASSTAASFLGGGGEAGTVGAATAEGAGTANAGLVDKLLGMYSAATGEKVRGAACCGCLGRPAGMLCGSQAAVLRLTPTLQLLPHPILPLRSQFMGRDEGEYDQLFGLAKQAMGTPVGRELLKQWVKQRLGI